MKKLLVGVLVLAGLVIGGDAAARVVAEHRVADELRSSFGLSEKPSVSIDGWPFLIHLVDGKFPQVTCTASNVSKAGITFSQVSVVLHGVHFPFPRALTGGHGTMRAARGSGTVELTGPDLTHALQAHNIPLSVTFSGGHMTVSSSTTGVGLEAPLSLDGASLQIGPVQTSATTIGPFHLELPTVVDGFNYASAHIADDQVVLTLGIRNKSFTF
jgi:hypothetical protein